MGAMGAGWRVAELAVMVGLVAHLPSPVLARRAAFEVTGIEEFEEYTNKTSVALVEYYAPWCQACQRLHPIIEQAAKLLRERKVDTDKVKILSVNTENKLNKALVAKEDVENLPTLRLYRDGEKQQYTRYRHPDFIAGMLQRLVEDPMRKISHQSQIEDEIEDNGIVTVAHLDPTLSDSEDPVFKPLKAFSEQARAKMATLYIRDAALSKSEGVTTFPTIRLQRQAEPSVTTMEPLSDDKEGWEYEIKDFVFIHATPLTGQVTEENYSDYVERGLPFVYLFLEDSQANVPDHSEDPIRLAYAEAAQKYLRNLTLTYYPLTTASYMSRFNFTTNHTPPLLGAEDAQGKRFIFTGSIYEAGAIDRFLGDVLSGEAEMFRRSDPPPYLDAETPDGIRVVVGSTFEEIMFNVTQDVILLQHAPWCQYCKDFMPEFEAFARSVQNIPTMSVVMMDGTTNDPPKGYESDGYPGVMLVTAGSNKKVVFDGDRNVEELIRWTTEHATSEYLADRIQLSLPESRQGEKTFEPEVTITDEDGNPVPEEEYNASEDDLMEEEFQEGEEGDYDPLQTPEGEVDGVGEAGEEVQEEEEAGSRKPPKTPAPAAGGAGKCSAPSGGSSGGAGKCSSPPPAQEPQEEEEVPPMFRQPEGGEGEEKAAGEDEEHIQELESEVARNKDKMQSLQEKLDAILEKLG